MVATHINDALKSLRISNFMFYQLSTIYLFLAIRLVQLSFISAFVPCKDVMVTTTTSPSIPTPDASS